MGQIAIPKKSEWIRHVSTFVVFRPWCINYVNFLCNQGMHDIWNYCHYFLQCLRRQNRWTYPIVLKQSGWRFDESRNSLSIGTSMFAKISVTFIHCIRPRLPKRTTPLVPYFAWREKQIPHTPSLKSSAKRKLFRIWYFYLSTKEPHLKSSRNL